jgi:UDP-2,3-diacylglucosamine hydrolase
VVDNKGDVDRLIILGDLFDFWTYPPDQTPPTTDEIIDANPNVFGANGALSKVLTAK